jgi:hypothetical protein
MIKMIKYIKLLAVCLLAISLTGCTITKVRINKHKSFVTYRFLDWTKVGNVKVSYETSAGTNVVVEIADYDSDREKALKDLAPLVKEAFKGLAEGGAKGLIPIP